MSAADATHPLPSLATIGITVNAYTLSTGQTLVRIQGTARETHVPTHTVILLDLSGSMNDDGKLVSVTRSLYFMLDQMSATDHLSLVTFEHEAAVRFARLALTPENKEMVRVTLSRLRADGGTNLSAAIVRSRECFFSAADAAAHMKQGILLLTDGHANVGVKDAPTINRLVSTLLVDHPSLTVTTVGYNTDHNADLLMQIATQGSGSYNVVNCLEDVATVFGDVLGGLQTCVAQQVELTSPTAATQATPFPATATDGQVRITLGDLLAGGEHVVLLNNYTAAAGPLTLRAYEMETGRPVEIPIPLRAEVTAAEETFGRINVMRVSVVTFLKKVKDSLLSLTPERREALLRERQALLTEIDTQMAEPSPLLSVLKEELLGLEMCLTAPASAPVLRAMTSVLAQHTSHLGACRGVRTNVSMLPSPTLSMSPYAAGGAGATLLAEVTPGADATNIFATVTQTQRSTALRAASSAVSYAPAHTISPSFGTSRPSVSLGGGSVSTAAVADLHTEPVIEDSSA
jgi:Mg-chelatase subunit ChlD